MSGPRFRRAASARYDARDGVRRTAGARTARVVARAAKSVHERTARSRFDDRNEHVALTKRDRAAADAGPGASCASCAPGGQRGLHAARDDT